MATKNTTTFRFRDIAGTRQRRVFIYTGPASYATGGDALTAAELGMGTIEAVVGNLVLSDGTNAFVGWWDRANAKIKWFVVDGAGNQLDEVAAATNLSTFTTVMEVIGK